MAADAAALGGSSDLKGSLRVTLLVIDIDVETMCVGMGKRMDIG